MPFLEHLGEVRELVPGELVVGSGTSAAWRVQNADLASRHLAFAVENGATRVRACSPLHLVVVNGRAVGLEPHPLATGDVVAAGGTRFLYLDRANDPRPPRWAAEPVAGWLVNDALPAAWPLDRRAVTLGRDAASHVQLRDPSVSRFHADVRREAGQFVLYAMGSSGTRVNDHVVARPQMLEEGDRITIGDATLRFTTTMPTGMPFMRGGDGAEDTLARDETRTSDRYDASGAPSGRRPALVAATIVAAAAVVTALAYLLRR